MNITKTLALTFATTAIVVLTGCGSNNSTTPQSGPIVAVTKTVTPAPVESTTYVTPKSCLAAIAAAERVFGHAGEFANTASKFPQLIPKAYHAGFMSDPSEAQDVVDRMDALTSEVKTENGNVLHDRVAFDKAATACRNNQ